MCMIDLRRFYSALEGTIHILFMRRSRYSGINKNETRCQIAQIWPIIEGQISSLMLNKLLFEGF